MNYIESEIIHETPEEFQGHQDEELEYHQNQHLLHPENNGNNENNENSIRNNFNQNDQQQNENTLKKIEKNPKNQTVNTEKAIIPLRIKPKGRPKIIKSTYEEKVKNNKSKPIKRKKKPGTKALLDIRKYQKSVNTLIPKAPFERLCREIVDQSSFCVKRMNKKSIEALQDGAEDYLVQLFQETQKNSLHRKKITITDKDMRMATKSVSRNHI